MPSKLFLIDGHALIFKMYYAFARHPMINSKGGDMSILFGFTKYLLELISREEPTHIAVAFDPPGGNFRKEIYPEYKATRAATPQLVIDALDPLCTLCKAMGMPVLMVSGYEADDVIGTVAKRFASKDMTVYMVTPDKDYGQLIDSHILQYKPGKAGGEREIYDTAAICSKYGISEPSQVIEMLAICGDTSDNVPGVKGVGEVGAARLIARYGTVKGIYEHIGELSERQRGQFLQAQDHMELSHDLVTIRTDVPVEVTREEMILRCEMTPELADLFEKYEFRSLARLVKAPSAPLSRPAQKESTPIRVVSPAELVRKIRAAGRCSVISGEGEKITLGAATDGAGYAAEFNVGNAKEILEDERIEKCGYGLKEQLNFLDGKGIGLEGKLLDIELMHYLINPERSHKADILAKAYLDMDIEEAPAEEEELSLFSEGEEADKPRTVEAGVLALLADAVLGDLGSSSELYWKMEEPLIRVLAAMERRGVRIDLSQIGLFADSLRSELAEYEARIREVSGDPSFNPQSPKQVGTLLFEKLRLDPKAKKSSKGSWSTDEATLAAISHKHPVVDMILECRALKKLLGTYIEPFPGYVSPADGRVHTTFNQALTSTGRLSSSNPNLQNIPIRTDRGREIRKAFVPGTPDGLILSADYSQIELRIMAHLSGDSHLIDAFHHGIDVHTATASKIFHIPNSEVSSDQRRIAKTANFGIMYGISAFGLAQRLGIGRSEAKKIIDDYFAAFPSIQSFISNTLAGAREKGYVETIFGRRRYTPDVRSTNATVRAMAERNAVNAPIQGTAADVIKLAMIASEREVAAAGLKSRMVLQIHDELLFDALPEEIEALKEIVVRCMEGVVSLSVPLTVECNWGKNWLEAH